MLIFSQSVMAQTNVNIDKITTTKTDMIKQSVINNSIELSIPMIGNVLINNVNDELRQATRPLNVNLNYSRTEMITESEIDKVHDDCEPKELLGK